MGYQTKAAQLGIAPDNALAPYTTKAGNYLLRSKHAATLRRITALAHAGRIREDGFGFPSIVKADGSWAGNCYWEVKMLVQRGLIERVTYLDPTAPVIYNVTRAGHLSLEAALRVHGQCIDTTALKADVDAGKVW